MLPRKAQKLLALIPIAAACECVLCGRRVRRFLPYRGGWAAAPRLMRELRLTGSDIDHYECPACGCSDRERHLLAYLRASGLLEAMRGKALLQFAPEPRLTPVLQRAGLARHVRADLFPASPDIEKVDMLAIPYPAETFDFVMANHVLEHVADDLRALAELRRVLRPGGWAILQTPFSAVLETTVSDPAVSTPAARLEQYGQEDHVRMYGRDIFRRFESAGFRSHVKTHHEALPSVDAARHGMNPGEPFFLFARAEP